MTLISRARLVFIVLALCAVLIVTPLTSAQTDPLPMSENFPTLGQMADGGTRNPRADLMATAVFANGGDASDNVLVEGGAPVEVNISLNAQPTTPVTLTYGVATNMVAHPKQITFSPENWNTPQTVEIYALNDYGLAAYNLYLDGIAIGSNIYYGYIHEQIDADGVYSYGDVVFQSDEGDSFFITYQSNPALPAAPTDPLVVTTLEDSYSTVIEGSLRQALLIAESRSTPLEVITFQAGLTGTLSLATDLPVVQRDISIIGPGQNLLTIDGGGQFMGFVGIGNQLGIPNIRVSGLTLSNLVEYAVYGGEVHLADVMVRDSGAGARMAYMLGAVTGFESLTVNHSTFIGNEGIFGGALTAAEAGVTINDSTFMDNHARPVRLSPGSSQEFAAGGGAIYAESEGNPVLISRSTFASNSGTTAGAIFINDSAAPVSGNHVTSNSTFSANFATQLTGAAAVGSIGSNYAVFFSTFSGHNTGAGSGGVIKGSNVGLEASVIANNSAPNPVECVGINGGGFLNFSADPNCNSIYPKGIPTGVDPVLRDNGGLTMTHALLPGSNVIDSDQRLPNEGNITYCESQLGVLFGATDQRGVARPQFGACDFGAFESNLLTLPPVNRSVNGSFEAAGATFNDADGWTGRNLNPDDYRRCDSALTPVAVQNGACAFMFRGPNANTEPRRLTQTLEGGGWSRAGKVLRLSAQVRTKNLGAGGRLAINVVYRDGTTGTALVRIPAGTNPYQRVMVRLPLAKRADSVTITVRLKTGGNQNTRLWVDNVILVSQ